MRKIKIITQDLGIKETHEDFEKRVIEFINKANVYDVNYSLAYDAGFDDYVNSVLVIYDD